MQPYRRDKPLTTVTTLLSNIGW